MLLQVKQQFDTDKPNVKRLIAAQLAERYKTHCLCIGKTFGGIFKLFRHEEEDAQETVPPEVNEDEIDAVLFAHVRFSPCMDAEQRVRLACRYYMWKRKEYDGPNAEAELVTMRRDLMIQIAIVFWHPDHQLT